jgi:hypothetical protein
VLQYAIARNQNGRHTVTFTTRRRRGYVRADHREDQT